MGGALCWFRLKAGTESWNRYSVTSVTVTKTSAGQKQPVVLSGGKEAFLTCLMNIISKIVELFVLHILMTIEGRQPHMPGLIPTLLAVQNNFQCYQTKKKKINSIAQIAKHWVKTGVYGPARWPSR